MNFEKNTRYANKLALNKRKERNKVPSEIEKWAMGLDETENINCDIVNYDSDEYDSIDDSYLEKMVIFDEEKNAKHDIKSNEERYLKVKAILDKIRNKTKNNQDSNNSQIQAVELTDYSTIKNYKKYLEKQNEEQLKKQLTREERSKKTNNSFLKLKSINNSMTRAVPGSLQQNITVERTFFKDLIKLSRQRYLSKLSSDFYMRRFLTVQSRKGLISDHKKISDSINSNINTTRMIKSAIPLESRNIISKSTQNKIGFPNKSISKHSYLKSFSALGAHSESESALNGKFHEMIDNEVIKSVNYQIEKKKMRPKTSIGSLNHLSTSILNIDDNTENLSSSDQNIISKRIETKVNLEKTYINDLKPIIDTRYTNLFKFMNEPYKGSARNLCNDEYLSKDPSRRVSLIISTNKALQGPGWNGSFEREKKNVTQIEYNMKLFEKLSIHSF